MLYVFAGYPQTRLNAGGLRIATEAEGIGLLEESPDVQYRKEGVFISTRQGEERRGAVEHRMSDLCLRDGITWDWCLENHAFGNGVTVHKTTAFYETKGVVHETDLTVEDLLRTGKVVDYSKLKLQQVHNRTEGWEKYEARWLPGTCPQESHIVHLTWLVFTHKLPEHAYEKLRRIVEVGDYNLSKSGFYEPKHFSATRVWNSEPAFARGELR